MLCFSLGQKCHTSTRHVSNKKIGISAVEMICLKLKIQPTQVSQVCCESKMVWF